MMKFVFIAALLQYFPITHTLNCDKLLGELGNARELFIYCSTKYAVPFTFCGSCQTQFDDMQGIYSHLRANCSKEYFDMDRLNLVASMQESLTGMWTRAFCADCNRDNISDIFDNKFLKLNICLGSNTRKECEHCFEEYQDLNSFYINLDQHNDGHICFDLQDSMNRTRSYWSKTLKCCQRTVDRTLFIVASSIISLMPILFYVGMYMLGKQRERNHDVLIPDDEPNAPPPPPPAQLIPAPITTAASRSADPPSLSQTKPPPAALDNDDDEILELDAEPPLQPHPQPTGKPAEKLIDLDLDSDSDDFSEESGQEYVVNKS